MAETETRTFEMTELVSTDLLDEAWDQFRDYFERRLLAEIWSAGYYTDQITHHRQQLQHAFVTSGWERVTFIAVARPRPTTATISEESR